MLDDNSKIKVELSRSIDEEEYKIDSYDENKDIKIIDGFKSNIKETKEELIFSSGSALEKQKSDLLLQYTLHRSREREAVINILSSESHDKIKKIQMISSEIRSIDINIDKIKSIINNEEVKYLKINNTMISIQAKLDMLNEEFDNVFNKIDNLKNEYKEYIDKDTYSKKYNSEKNKLLNLNSRISPFELLLLKEELKNKKMIKYIDNYKNKLDLLVEERGSMNFEKEKLEISIESIVNSISLSSEGSRLKENTLIESNSNANLQKL